MYNFLAINTSSILLTLIFIFISFFCLFLFVENHKLREQVKKLQIENKKLLEIKITKQKNIDSIPINKISTNDKKNINNNQQTKKIELVTKQPVKDIVKATKKDEKHLSSINNKNSKAYQRNMLHDKPNITSSVSLTKAEDDFNLNEFIKTNELKVEKKSSKPSKKDTISNKDSILNILSEPSKLSDELPNSILNENIKMTTSKKTNNIDYLQEISNKMADELKPQTIELTDYEKLQEENAIISYKELLTLKDKIMMLDDEDETINFIEELKNLRNSLK